MSQLTAFESITSSELSALVLKRMEMLEQSNAALAVENKKLQQEKKSMSEKLGKYRNFIERQKEDKEELESQLKFAQESHKIIELNFHDHLKFNFQKSKINESCHQAEMKDLKVKLELSELNLSLKTDDFTDFRAKLTRPGAQMEFYNTELERTTLLLNKEKQKVSDLKNQVEEAQEKAIKINTTLFMTRMEANEQIDELKTQIENLKKENDDLKTQIPPVSAVLIQSPQLPTTSTTRKQAERKRAATVAVRAPYPKRGRPTKEESERRKAEAEKQTQTAIAQPSVAKRGPGRPKKEKKE